MWWQLGLSSAGAQASTGKICWREMMLWLHLSYIEYWRHAGCLVLCCLGYTGDRSAWM